MRASGGSISGDQGRDASVNTLHAPHCAVEHTVHYSESACLHCAKAALELVECRRKLRAEKLGLGWVFRARVSFRSGVIMTADQLINQGRASPGGVFRGL